MRVLKMAALRKETESLERSSEVDESAQSQPEVGSTKVAQRIERGGYECEFVEHPTRGVQSECPICLLILRDPHQVTCCGYSYCESCIERVSLSKNACPTCNDQNFTVFPDKRLKRSLYEFRVRCTHQKEGCKWVGELVDLDKHLNENPAQEKQLVGCHFVEIKCLHCVQYFQRCCIEAHQSDSCPCRPFSCNYCQDYVGNHKDVVSNHWPVCPCYPLICPNECDSPDFIERQNLQQHLERECLLAVVSCDFHYAGCDAKLPRKDMLAHLTDKSLFHISLLGAHNRKLMQKVVEKEEQITRLTTGVKVKVEELKNENQALKEEIAQLRLQQGQDRTSLETVHSYAGILPVEFTMTNFEEQRENNRTWFSPSFYTHPYGYKVCLNLYANGCGKGGRSHISLFAYVMCGKFDSNLSWPFQGHITVQLLNQLNDSEHLSFTIYCSDASDRCVGKVTTGERGRFGWGMHRLIPHTALAHDPITNRQYLKDNCLRLRVIKVVNVNPLPQVESLAVASLAHIAPTEFILPDYEQYKRESDPWYSPPFYTHPFGYKMCLYVNVNDMKGAYMSVFVHLMQGLYDNKLHWPFQGSVTIQLLNQLEDQAHHMVVIKFTRETHKRYTSRVFGKRRAEGLGKLNFIPDAALTHDSTKNCQYVKDNCLRFRVSQVELKK